MSVLPEQALCPVVVGRDDELTILRSALDRALQGYARGIFISGEAGIGKSRLCRGIIKDAQLRGLAPVIGLSSPQDLALPFGPVVDALRRALTRMASLNTPLQPALAPVAPSLALLLPELGVAAPQDAPESPMLQRRHFFDALTHALRTVAALGAGDSEGATPLVLVLEDLHWADESTLELLQFLFRSTAGNDPAVSVPGQGMLVVGTFRVEGLADAPTVTRTLSALLATRTAHQLELRPLTVEQLEHMLEATLGRPVSPDVVSAFFERGEGNPFVTEELLGALAAAGQLDRTDAARMEVAALHLPLSLRGAVLDRLGLLPLEARELLSTAAVVGRVFDLDLLAAVTGLESDALWPQLRLTLRGNLIEENPAEGGSATATTGDRYRFRHALTRDVIYEELLGPERRTLHAAVARALEARLSLVGDVVDGDTIEALAYHYRLAGDRVKAPDFALRAAERDRALLAFAEARRHYAEALAYFPAADPARLPILEQLGLLSLALLDIQGAVPYLDAATALLRALGLTRKAAVVAGEMHHLLWFIDLARFQAMVGELDALAEAAYSGGDGAGPADADALATYAAAALAHAVYAHYDRADLWARRAFDLAAALRRAGHPTIAPISPSTYKAMLARGHARLHGLLGEGSAQETAEAGIRDLRETLELGQRHALPEVVQLTYNFLPRGLLELGRDAEAAALIDAADEYARRSGVAPIADMRGYALLFAGRWSEGVALMREAIEVSRVIGSPGKLALELTALGHLLAAQGDGAGAIAVLSEALALLEPSGQFVTLAPCLTGLACACARNGDEDRAAALYERGRMLWQATQDRGTVIALLLEGCLFYAGRGETPRAEEWAGDLAAAAGPMPLPVAAAALAHARGSALAAAGDHAAAQRELRDAMARWSALRRPYEGAWAQAALGAGLLATAGRVPAQRAAADAELVAAEDTFRRLGAARDLAGVADLRRRAGLQAQERRRQSLAQGRAPYGDLTPREREVLRLLAEGRTNRAIAQALFIAEGTAELHVSRILGKLGCSTRSQAVAYAVAHHLIENP